MSPNDSVKKLLDRIVDGYSKGPYSVIELSYNSFELRDAVCRKLSQAVFDKVFKEACAELGVSYNKFDLRENAIDCAPHGCCSETAGVKSIQVSAK